MALASVVDNATVGCARIGVVVLETDETMETEFRGLFSDPDLAVFHSRIPMQQAVTVDGLKAMEAALPTALDLLPKTAPLGSVGFGCTSAATLIGQDRVAEIAGAIHPGAPMTNPVSAAIAAFQALGVRRIGLVTPYLLEICQAMIDLFAQAGVETTAFGSFERPLDYEVARIAPASILDAVLEIGSSPDADAVFVSCTNLKALGVIEEAEARLGKPVVSSNQAFGWHLAKLAGVEGRLTGPGTLLRTAPLAQAAE